MKALARSPLRLSPAWFAEAKNRAEQTLSLPPAKSHIVRSEPRGMLAARFALPLSVCPTLNAFAEMESWRRGRLKEECLLLMRTQYRERARVIARPYVRAVRFSSTEPDRDSGWPKVPVDRLTSKHAGLGLIEDDKPSVLDLRYWHEPASPGKGFVYLELWST
jgi:hypothetical protein